MMEDAPPIQRWSVCCGERRVTGQSRQHQLAGTSGTHNSNHILLRMQVQQTERDRDKDKDQDHLRLCSSNVSIIDKK
jgi:hypothetical protein